MNWNKLYSLGETLENALLSLVIRAGPWLGPAPTAFLVYDRVRINLGFPAWVCVVTGLTLEGLGVASAATALKFWQYNAGKLKSEPSAPTKLASVLVGLYFCAALFLTLALDTLDGATRFAPVAFVVLSLASVSLLGLRLAHAGAFMTKSERKAARKAEKQRLAAEAEEERYTCWCGREFTSRSAYNVHQEQHQTEVRSVDSVPAALALLKEKYPTAWDNGRAVTAEEVREWQRA